MNYSKVVQATMPLAEIRKMKLPYAKAKLVYDLHRAFESEVTFFRQEEAKLIETYARKNEEGKPEVSATGVITFESVESKTEYLNEVNKLLETELTIEIPHIVITAEDMGTQMLSPETIEKLEDVIFFE